MGKPYLEYLNTSDVYKCKKCGTHFACESDINSKTFRGKTGTAYLFDMVLNYTIGMIREETLATGSHKIADIY
jgi:hypothetical protein